MVFSIRIKNHLPAMILIIAPFVYYYWFMLKEMHPVEYPDSFAYLWRQAFNVHYLLGRSLTQRVLFTLSMNSPQIISVVQLLFYFLIAVLIYIFLSVEKNVIFNVPIAGLISFIFSSYTLNVSAVVINSEPIFLGLVILFPCLVVLYRGPYRQIFILLFGVAFVLSKNVAPHMLFLIISTWAITSTKIKGVLRNYSFIFLVLIATLRMILTSLYDTSIHVNVLNNLYRRVFIDEEITSHFQKNYGMPVGPFVQQCKGEWVGIPCFGYHLLTINPQTRNYVLLEDGYGLTNWIRSKGQRSYAKFLIIDNGLKTWRDFGGFFHRLSTGNNMRFMVDYIGADIPENEPNNLDQIRARAWGQERGFWGFDSLSILHVWFVKLGFARVEIILLYALFGLALLHGMRYSRYLSMGVSMLVCSLGLCFLNFYGDAMEIIRHAFPALVLLVLGGIFYIAGILEIGFYAAKCRRVSGHSFLSCLRGEMS